MIQLYQDLLSEFGHPSTYWPQWCADHKTPSDREKIIIGMILVQHTSWHNANIALQNLKQADLLSLHQIANLKSLDQLTQLIRPAGFCQSKPRRLFDISTLISQNPQPTRQQLLALRGVGFETADTLLLYAFDQPVFVIDEYTKRFVAKENLIKSNDYTQLQKFFQDNLEHNPFIYQNFHALIIISQRGREKSIMEVV